MTVETKPAESQSVDYEKPDESVEIHVPRRNIERAIIGLLALIGAGGGGLAVHEKIAQPTYTEVAQNFQHIHDVLEGEVKSNASKDEIRYERAQAELNALRLEMAECRTNILNYLFQRKGAGGSSPPAVPGIAEWLK